MKQKEQTLQKSQQYRKSKRSNIAPLKIQFEEGQRAFYNGKLRNPYPSYHMRFKEWERGFNLAYFKNKAKLKRKK